MRRVQLLGFGGHARLDVGDPLAHPLLERRDGALERVLGALEVGLPGAKTLLDALLDGSDELGHRVGELSLPHRELAAPLVGEPPLLGDVCGERVGLCARDRDSKLLRLRRRLLLGGRANRAARLRHELLGACRPGARASQRKRQEHADDDDGTERGHEDPGERGHAATLDPESPRERPRARPRPRRAAAGPSPRPRRATRRRARPPSRREGLRRPSTVATRRRTKRT